MSRLRDDQLDSLLRRMAEVDSPLSSPTPSARERVDRLLVAERWRAKRRLLAAVPLLFALSACMTYGAVRWAHSFSASVELVVDGQKLAPQAIELRVEDGVIQPVNVPVRGVDGVEDGTVELQLEAPEGVAPETLDGMKVLAVISTDPYGGPADPPEEP